MQFSNCLFLWRNTLNFEEKLRTYRKEKNISQEQLAEKIGVTRQAVSRWETGKSLPDIHTLHKISKILDISIEDFVDDYSYPKREKKEVINKKTLMKHYSKYLYILLVAFTLACTLPKDISVPIMFFGKLIIIFFILLLIVYFIIKKYLE